MTGGLFDAILGVVSTDWSIVVKTKKDVMDENRLLLQHIARAEAAYDGLRKRNGQLLGVIEIHCPKAHEQLTDFSTRFNPISKVNHLIDAAIRKDWDTCSEIVDTLVHDFSIDFDLDSRRNRRLSPEHIAKMKAGREAKENARNLSS